MTSNPYFAYSIKSGYLGDPGSLSDTSQSVDTNGSASKKPTRKKRNTSRACDVCSIRKTKCDNSRPCRLCVATNVKCTELRVRKKSGPKTFRKKTIDSINSVGAQFSGIASDRHLVAQLDSGSSFPDLALVVNVLSRLPVDFLQELVPFTLPGIAEDAIPLMDRLQSCPHVLGGSVDTNLTRYAVTTLCLVLLEMLLLVDKPADYDAMLWGLQVHILLIRSACERLVMFGQSQDKINFDTQFYLALAELHQFSYLMLKAAPNSYKLVHLRAAMAHCDLLTPHTNKDMYRKAELRRTLQLWERHMFLFGTDAVFRNVGTFSPQSQNPGVEVITDNHFVNSYYELLRVLDSMKDPRDKMPEPFAWKYRNAESRDQDLTYAALKLNINTIFESGHLLRRSGDDAVIRFLSLAVRFKLVLVSSQKFPRQYVSGELMELIMHLNVIMGEAEPQFKFLLEKFTFTTVLLEVLAAYLQMTPEDEFMPEGLSALIQFTTILSTYVNDRSKEHMEDPQISGWFARFTTN
ncbi:hypothetical protein METBIDRAFT_121912 [Metschnikowia bicuspidata var. bicuspidata NRRL YB-4993]|uniref:Zn(2)-C6 fungal-type domain-containing protein n=1 Tax=Metschnikowia bicuspidata var. bicuspidata NRRL YB-4993 TaxID=869754 RepID=A0A1A0HJT5_9ASCO|nr:hypothetical protein METBIDRAFT_121912 [Metschnikowia bicuspidata var. bicuspidata NRRL YB-4993]OBA24280.1 hypothetical protein METBIDRAFT_121912 [Metschnikowia bicuspidata var. bicuspidata NRRL YB-4993]